MFKYVYAFLFMYLIIFALNANHLLIFFTFKKESFSSHFNLVNFWLTNKKNKR